jgi:hypothetical protein
MNRADQLIDKAADRLRDFADRASAQGGIAAKLSDELADDAAFLRRLKPSLIVARAKGEVPTDRPAGAGAPSATPGPLLENQPNPGDSAGGPSPLVIVGAAFAVGVVLAIFIDRRARTRAS